MYRKLLIIFTLLIFFPFLVSAQISPRLAVSPHTFELDIFPGETITKKIKLTNKSQVALPILARTTDFTASDEEGGMAFDELSQDISFASRKWIKIENPNFILNPGETREVYFTIQVPENAEPGGHYAVMLFEPQLPSFYFEESKPRVIPVIGVLFLSSVKIFTLEPEVKEKLEVIEFAVPREERLIALENLTSAFIGGIVQAANEVTITKESPSNFILRIKNNDIYHIKPFGKVLIFNIFGKKIGEAEVSKTTILPGKIRKFPIEFSPETPKYLKWLPETISDFLAKNFFFGKYQARLVIETSNRQQETENDLLPLASLTFFSFPWHFWLPFLLILALFLFFSVRYRKRIRLAIKILVSRKSASISV
jgi:hypothetical protein